ncbi:dihydrofolate reductase family protein [Pinisolibacter aquiterrae]|uniref:dihydrofolate reductase family protein n=1 Tax=Pinisolibacter aquiterrae TaxID=2815579 RepID=UPI001C3E3FD1|nr:dihydrofolate reductase family protein [Pinisolibacter aquiterrae]MBV5262731.1 dihydrofolate reductase [Pinisolibacter aquiterrae]MCC8233551.1 dihydrofolate reductase family protein [Pinisolibacter aquiterrae]
MPEVVVYIAQSIDGFIADRDGSIDWLKPFDAADYGWEAFIAGIDAVVMGSVTYRECRRFPEWPYRGKACFVMTKGPRLDEDGLAVFDDRSAVEIAVDCERAGLKRIWVVGGGGPIRAFLDAGLVRRIHLFQIPILLGAGTPLWVAGRRRWEATMVRATVHPNGVVETVHTVEVPSLARK